MFYDITWFVTFVSIIGTFLNVKRSKAGFIVWTFTNGFWAAYDYYLGAYAQSALFTVYMAFSLWGWWEWRDQ